jgi:hypothetical protein
MLCVNYYSYGKLTSRRFDFANIAEAQREAELYTRAFSHSGQVAAVSHYDA